MPGSKKFFFVRDGIYDGTEDLMNFVAVVGRLTNNISLSSTLRSSLR